MRVRDFLMSVALLLLIALLWQRLGKGENQA
ncbi:hypothetical protein EV664_1066 [Stakelama pacifica]|uniref:Uncharacterized protein n=1 Tax=Stakelama pacifica TaxID=517720 RepID=A0A4R6FMI1_9SPHN|nr:hypothetical protein EV664_1066 [Stakelama pacifica]